MARRIVFQPPAERLTEVRVHGVGGTPPTAVLDDSRPTQVSGDDDAGFFRRSEKLDGRTIEAYYWGGLTSRSPRRSLWILLLPFMLTNLAGWMIESEAETSSPKRQIFPEVQERLVRLICFMSTVAITIWIAALFVDLIAFQCGSKETCVDDRWWLAFFENDRFNGFSGRRLVVGLVPTLLFLLGLGLLGRRSRRKYEEYRTGNDQSEAGDAADLQTGNFWHRPSIVADMAALHGGGALATVVYVLSLALIELHENQAGPVSVPWDIHLLRWTAATFLAIAIAAIVLLRWKRGVTDERKVSSRVYFWGGMGSGVLLFLWGTIRAATIELSDPEAGVQVFRHAPFYILVSGVLVALVLGLIQFVFWLKQSLGKGREARRSWRARALAFILFGLFVILAIEPNVEILYLALILGVACHVALSQRVWPLVVFTLAAFALALWVGQFIGGKLVFDVAVAVLAVAYAFIAVERLWEPDRFRWGAATVASLLGLILVSGVFAGAATRLTDFLDREQGAKEIKGRLIEFVDDQLKIENVRKNPRDNVTRALRTQLDIQGVERAESTVEGVLVRYGAPVAVRESIDSFFRQPDARAILLHLPDAYKWLSVAIVAALGLVLSSGGVSYLRRWREDIRPTTPATLQETTPGLPDGARLLMDEEKANLNSRVKRSIALRLSAGSGDLVLTFLVGLLLLAATAALFNVDWRPRDLVDEPFPRAWGWLGTPSTWLVSFLPVVGIGVFRSSFRKGEARRKLGILWDLGTFWPRRYHPFAPPSYAERAVPELQERIRQTDKVGKAMIIAAHSQGSVVSFAALTPFLKKPQRGQRFVLVTYGSPLGSYFRRFFPAYFTTDLFLKVQHALEEGKRDKVNSWHNFFRETDPIGGQVFSDLHEPQDDLHDQLLRDPWWWWRIPGQPAPYLQVHSEYMDDPEMRDWIAAAANDLYAGLP